jgi:hypothetical protein
MMGYVIDWAVSGVVHLIAGAACAYLFHDRIAAMVAPVVAMVKTIIEHAGKIATWARGKK